ncbi:MAG TPA: (d)CMP kinase [Candidatus Merdicola faecigallinarum]|uniref:Cytidylate kinase n=1 Tax=Candidatus Merdicola faecigallinarum TaxID=2840862 RepID=A0A9D1S8M6_9FIRM|nr:(d)CMP kinase [Candidatus Merdicola faecigallinarum]
MAFIVAIDGPAGSGKGTITKLVGEKLGLVNIDTGATYRCVTLAALQKGYTLEQEEKIVELLNEIQIELKKENGKEKFYLNHIDVTDEIRTPKVNAMVSQVSHIPQVRDNMANFQRKMAEGKDVIMEGRDIGTNVFPNADVKIYLDATPEERAKRRILQNQEKGIESTYEEILENIKFRDHNDKTSSVAPLKQAEDAIYVDSSHLTIEEVTDKIIKIIQERREKK